MNAPQLDLFGDVAAWLDHQRRAQLYHEHMSEDWRKPGRKLTVRYPHGGVGKAVRCGRCGKVVPAADMIISHDRGYGGCPHEPHLGYACRNPAAHPNDPTRRKLNDRADAAVFPPCAACGDAWGLHTSFGALPAYNTCTWYDCRGYVPPKGAVSPWGTCLGCWGEPHDGPCPPAARRPEALSTKRKERR